MWTDRDRDGTRSGFRQYNGRACYSSGRPKTPAGPKPAAAGGATGASPDAARWGADDVVGSFSGAGRSTVASMSRRLSLSRWRYGDALLGISGPILPNGFNSARLQVP